MAEQEQGNITQEYNNATAGLNLDQTLNQIPKGRLTYALNASVENFDANSVNYQNEPGNELCVSFPSGYLLIGSHFIPERNKHIFFITNPETRDSQIGYMENNDCVYRVLVNAPCLNFDINYPIHKVVHKLTNCSTEIYWTDGYNSRRYLDIDNIPKVLKSGTPLCNPEYTDDLDCNQLKLQPNFNIPQLAIAEIKSTGNLEAGTYQFAVQYSDSLGNPFTSYYSVTNPTPIADPAITSVNFNYPVGKSIVVNVSNLDGSGLFEYFNLAVIKTVNAITSVELVGTYYIDNLQKQITYTGQNETQIRLSINDIFEKFPYYDIAQDLTSVQDILVWDNLASISRVNYQKIANQISLQWESWRIPANENYADETNATNLRSYLRDEVYPFEIVFLLRNGKQTDGFHIPGRVRGASENRPDVPSTDPDFVGSPSYESGGVGYSPYWKIYNTASVTGFSTGYTPDPNYKGPYQFGEFAYWESLETYPCNTDVWGDLAGQPIRHHKFPDVLVSPIYESKIFAGAGSMAMGNDAIFPIGVRIDPQQIATLIQTSSLTDEQKDEIVGFKIVRGDRSTNKSIVAKGMLRNVNSYRREEQDYFYPNYPYNDLRQDPFLTVTNNAFTEICNGYDINITQLGPNGYAEVQYTSCNNNKTAKQKYYTLGTHSLCSTSKPIIIAPAKGEAGVSTYDEYTVQVCPGFLVQGARVKYVDRFKGETCLWVEGWRPVNSRPIYTLQVVPGTVPVKGSCPGQPGEGNGDLCINYVKTVTGSSTCKDPEQQPAVTEKYRQIFNSPETSFGQPFLGNVLKLESVMFGPGKAHFVEVKKNAKYKLITEEAQRDALKSSQALANITSPFNPTAMFTAYQAYLAIYINGITRKNYAYSFNSIADYNYGVGVPNDLGVKQRPLDIARYLIPGVQNVGDIRNINNYNRESSVYLRTDLDKPTLPFASESPNMLSGANPIVVDRSRFTISEIGNCDIPAKEESISVVSYYASIKNIFDNQWGQIYSYEKVDTGFQALIGANNSNTVFGGDTFIGRFAFKTKLPFFIDNRVNAPDDSDIFYDEIGNVAYPKYWHSARSILKDYTVDINNGSPGTLSNIISYKAHEFDCPNDQKPAPPAENPNRTFYDGYFYLFAYGIPSFYCESAYNLDLRQAFNNREGDFWPHVSTSIPDDWVQESFVTIAQDNTYHYNVTFSKQNRENTFTNLPIDWDKPCYTYYPFRAIYSDPQNIDADNRVNNWRIYRAISYFDFPQNFGDLISLDGIQNKAVLARFENKTLMYNNLLTVDTSNPQAAYFGNPQLFKGAPPIDFAETDLGFVGSQHKMLLKIPQGQVSIDAKRGQVFLITGTQVTDLSGFGSGMNRFFTDHLAFEILRYFPNVNIDNHFKGLGLHGVYDSKYDRVLITKLDYIPKSNNVKYDSETREFYVEETVAGLKLRTKVELTDTEYFCNKSWTLSFNFNTKSWISFHSYLPNWYIAENNFFYSGLNGCCETFNFVAGVPVAIPTTTTTTTNRPPLDCRLAGTTDVKDCTLAGNVQITQCALAGNAVVTVPAPPAPCTRPEGLSMQYFFTGYTTPPTVVNSTASSASACAAVAYLNSLGGNYSTTYPNYITVEVAEIKVGQGVYLSNGTNDCSFAPNGWYFTEETMFSNTVFQVVNGYILNILDCTTTTTTSSTSTTTTSSSTSTTTTSSTSTTTTSTSSTTTTSTTITPTTTTTTTTSVPCGVTSSYSGNLGYPITQSVNLGSDTGVVSYSFNAYSVPDRFIVRWNGGVVIDTGYRGSSDYDFGGANRSGFNADLNGKVDPITLTTYPNFTSYPDDGYPRVTSPGSGVASFNKTLANPALALVEVYAPMSGTAWEFTMGCPGATTTTTTSITTIAPVSCDEYFNNTGNPITGVGYTDCGGTIMENQTVDPNQSICVQQGTLSGGGFLINLGNCGVVGPTITTLK